MALPYIIEYLLSLRRPSGGNLVHMGASQTLIPQVPPYAEFVLREFPAEGDYLDIVYKSWVDPSVVPGAFYGWLQYFGNRIIEGTFTPGFMAWQWDGLVFISQAEPATISIRNNTALYQYYAGISIFVAITSVEDFNTVLEYLKGAGMHEANLLLEKLLVAGGG